MQGAHYRLGEFRSEKMRLAPGNAVGKGDSTVSAGNDDTSDRKNLDVSEALRSYIQERVIQTVEKFVGRETTGHVRIEKEHGEFRTNCTIHLWQGMSLEAHGAGADRACERLEKRVRRYKRRLKRHGGGETPRKQTPATD